LQQNDGSQFIQSIPVDHTGLRNLQAIRLFWISSQWYWFWWRVLIHCVKKCCGMLVIGSV